MARPLRQRLAIPPSITTPDKVETRLGTLEFKDGAPSKDTLDKVYDNLDFTHAFEAFVNTFQGVNAAAIRKGLLDIGVKDNEILMFSELMDAKSLFLTANADTVYFVGFIDLTKGPMVLETPPKALGTLDDMWWRWVIDFGLPGPDRGDGRQIPAPAARLRRPAARGRILRRPVANHPRPDPRPHVHGEQRSQARRRVDQGSSPKSIPTRPAASARASPSSLPARPSSAGSVIRRRPCSTKAAARSFNTIPPNDFSYFEMLNEVVQQEPATALDPELMGPLAAIGIIKGKPFAPDARMKKILTEALALANATSRSLLMNPRDPSWFYYPGSAWLNSLFVSGYEFETPIPMIEGPVRGGSAFPKPPNRSRPPATAQLDARTAFFYGVTGITPAMAMRMTGIGSQYLFASLDADKNYFDGAKTYKVTLPKGIPEEKFWSFTLYDNQTRSMLDTPQRYPRAGSQSYPSPAAEAERRRLDHGLLRPDAAARRRSAATGSRPIPEGLVHDPAPLQPARTVLHEGVAAERDRAGEGERTRAALRTV